MSEHGAWEFDDLDGYTREGEPAQAQRAENWQIAIGLQAVDGLKTSDYLLETAKEHVEGRIDAGQAQQRIRSYYEERSGRENAEGSEEADKVSVKIAELLGERAFTFSPAQLQGIHRRLFEEVFPGAGKYRTYNITKKEWVLKGATVLYAPYDTIADTLAYDFGRERGTDYRAMASSRAVSHFAAFVSGIWQIHPFPEGNTRTTAVFAIKYLRSLGYEVGNEPFKDHSWYFRNALVRANYNDCETGVRATDRYLVAFFENVLLGAGHELKNRFMHVDWPGSQDAAVDEDRSTDQEADQVTDQVTDQVSALLDVLGDEVLSARELMDRLGLSHRPTFRQNYLNPALRAGLIERTIPDKPTSRLQKYRAVRSELRGATPPEVGQKTRFCEN